MCSTDVGSRATKLLSAREQLSDTLVSDREPSLRRAAGHTAGERSENEAQHLDSSLPAGGENAFTREVTWPLQTFSSLKFTVKKMEVYEVKLKPCKGQEVFLRQFVLYIHTV